MLLPLRARAQHGFPAPLYGIVDEAWLVAVARWLPDRFIGVKCPRWISKRQSALLA